jgi:hypothetical protein
MISKRRNDDDALDHLADALAEDIANLTDKAALAETAEDYGRPQVLAEEFDKLFERTLWQNNVRRAEVRKKSIGSVVAGWLRGQRTGWAFASVLLIALVSQTSYYVTRPSTPVVIGTQPISQPAQPLPPIGTPTRSIGLPVVIGERVPSPYSPRVVVNPVPGGLPQATESMAVVRFAPEASAAEITRVLEEYNVSIVDGPNPDGFFRIRLPKTISRDQTTMLIKELQSAHIVDLIHVQ